MIVTPFIITQSGCFVAEIGYGKPYIIKEETLGRGVERVVTNNELEGEVQNTDDLVYIFANKACRIRNQNVVKVRKTIGQDKFIVRYWD